MPICCVALIPLHCGVLLGTPHSSEFRVPCILKFLISLHNGCFAAARWCSSGNSPFRIRAISHQVSAVSKAIKMPGIELSAER
jgi:hypothetical protein